MLKNLKRKFAKVTLVVLALQLAFLGLGTGATGAYAAEPLTPLTAISAIEGTPQVGLVLTAGALTPADATVIYKWKVSDTGDDGSFTDIPGATTNTYTPIITYVNKYVRVVATGTGSFTGIQRSLPVGPVADKTPLTAINAIVGTPQVGQILTAGALTPPDAIVDYQWRISGNGEIGTFTDILGVTSSNYTPIASDFGKYLRVFATGTDNFAGVAKSAVIGPIAAQTPLTSIEAIVGTPQVGQVLTAGALTPADATVVYKWKVSGTGDDGSFTDIPGAISNAYTLVASDLGKFIRVVATGTGSFTGKAKSTVGPIVAQPVVVVVVDTEAPLAVTGVITFVDGAGHVKLSWINTEAYTTLRIVRDGTVTITLDPTDTTYLDLTTLFGGTYKYVIIVGDAAGNETNMPQVTVSVPAAVVAAAFSDSDIPNTWAADYVAPETNTNTNTSPEEVKAGTDEANNPASEEDNGFPTWGIILLLILAAVGGYLIWSQKPEETPVVGKTKTGTTKKK